MNSRFGKLLNTDRVAAGSAFLQLQLKNLRVSFLNVAKEARGYSKIQTKNGKK
jgi:hypothetical protein